MHKLSFASQLAGGEVQLNRDYKSRNRSSGPNQAEAALDDTTLKAAGMEPKRGMILPFQPLSISFDDIKYFVDMPAVRTVPPHLGVKNVLMFSNVLMFLLPTDHILHLK